jgi:glycine oxidase
VRVGIVGCGVVGSAIAYRLSKSPELEVLVYDGRSPQKLESTGAALGVLMAVSCSKLKGRHLKLRLESLQWYERLIPELIAHTQIDIPYNRNGIVQLFFDEAELARWHTTQTVRAKQGFQLDIWDRNQLVDQFPELAHAYALDSGHQTIGAVYSPEDRQTNPEILTQALIQGSIQNKTQVHFESPVSGFCTQPVGDGDRSQVTHLCIQGDTVSVDWVVIAAGLGSAPLTQSLQQPISMGPVLGQALHLRCTEPMRPNAPVINGGDLYVVPLNTHELWVGATVEYLAAETDTSIEPNPDLLEELRERAIALYPPLANAEMLQSWQGLRPRPNERAAPVIECLPGYKNVLIATGHYRNGVLLAPVTAEKIWSLLQEKM